MMNLDNDYIISKLNKYKLKYKLYNNDINNIIFKTKNIIINIDNNYFYYSWNNDIIIYLYYNNDKLKILIDTLY